MAVTPSYFDYLRDQLGGVEDIRFKKMFGGLGIFRDGLMFALVSSEDKIYLKVDDTNRGDFESKGMTSYNPSKKGKGMPYWEIPSEVLEDKSILKNWVEKAIAVAIKARK